MPRETIALGAKRVKPFAARPTPTATRRFRGHGRRVLAPDTGRFASITPIDDRPPVPGVYGPMLPHRIAAALVGSLAACAESAASPDPCDMPGALSNCLSPTRTDDEYIEQGQRYFDTLDASADPESEPTYAELVARWEWPPWLLLTGYGAELTLAVDELVLAAFPGTTVPTRDCRAFEVQPFGRCRVSIDYEGQACPIYEEFTFNDAGEVTFVEAWSDQAALLPWDVEADPWAEGEGIGRLSTRVPGLGTEAGRIDPTGEEMTRAGETDAEVADFAARTQDFWGYWSEAYDAAGDDMFARGCGW